MTKQIILYLMLFVLSASTTNAQHCAAGPSSTADSNVESVNLTGDAASAISFTGCPGVSGVQNLKATQTVSVTAGMGYTADIQFGTCGGDYAGAGEAWIDWNKNDIFDASESIGTWTGTPPVALSNFAFTVPAGAINGNTVLRVMQREGGTLPLDPCGTYSWGSVMDFTVVVSGGVTLTCAAPNLLTASTPSATTANVGWTENGTATSWQIEYGPQAGTQGTGSFSLASTNPHLLTGLTAATAYKFYVRAICAPGDTSSWAGPFNFTTPCAAFTAPYLQPFATNAMPTCWTPGGVTAWEYGSVTGTTPTGFADYGANTVADHSMGGGGTFIGMDGSDNTNGEVSTLTSPLVDISPLTNPLLSYWVFSNNTDDAAQNRLYVELFDGGTWTPIDSVQANLGATWIEFTTDLSAFTGPVQVRFTVTGVANSGSTYYNDILIDDVKFDEAPSCLAPSALTAVATSATTANLGWTENGAATSWQIEYGPQAGAQGTGSFPLASSNPHLLTGLTASTAYKFYVRAICAVGDTSAWVGPFNFATPAACPAPTALTATAVMATSANLGWTENGSATSWQIEYGPQAGAQGTGSFPLASSNPHILTGLTPNTAYKYYVRAICGAGDSSTWAGPFNFMTPCTAFTPTYLENFATYLPGCWSEAKGVLSTPNTVFSSTASEWTADGFASVGMTGAARMNIWSTGRSEWLMSPSIDLGTGQYQLEFDIALTPFNALGSTTLGVDDTVAIVISTDNGVTWNMANVLQYWLAGSEPSGTGDHITLDLRAYSGVVKFGFYAASTVANADNDLSIDSFLVTNFVTPPTPALVINEIMYNPAEAGTDSTEFVEIYNNGSTTVDLTGFTLSGAVYTFPAASSIAAGGYYVVAFNAAAFTNVYGTTANGVFTTGLVNGGESIVLKDNFGSVVDSVYYRSTAPWPTGSAIGSANGGGASLILCDANTDNNDGANWKPATTAVGVIINTRPVLASPGAANVCPVAAPDVEATSFSGVNATYCNVAAISGSIVLSNVSATASNKVYYTITASGFPVIADSVATIAGMGSVTIPIGPIPAATGVVNLVLTTTSAGDVNATNNSVSMMVSVSNTDAAAAVTTAVLCNGDSNGALTASATGGLANPYNYVWSANAGSQTSAMITGLMAGTYMVTATDSIGCSDSATVVLTQPTAISSSATVTNVSCNAAADGMATAMGAGGTGSYTYLWSNNATTSMATGLAAGSASCTITDANGCAVVEMVTVTEPIALVASAVDNGDGSATAMGTGGTGAYSYMWDVNSGSQTTAMATGLMSNTAYAVTITDANGCMDSTMITVIFNSFETIANVANLNMFPNPSSGNVFVELDLVNNADVQITVLNAIGQVTISKLLTNVQSEKVELETSTLASGIYMVQFVIGTEQVTRKLIISKQ